MSRRSAESPSPPSSASPKRLRPSVKFGPFLSDRQWSTIREDSSDDGSCWQSCDFVRSHRDPYSAGEDGIFGVCDTDCRLCLSWAFWNGRDPMVKEKFFGVTGGPRYQGNHGEDVKEVYFYQLHSPDHKYMRAKYMYPCGTYPYMTLVSESERRSQRQDEFEIADSAAFECGHWQLQVEWAAASDGDTVGLLTASNCSDRRRTLHALPTVWFRNTWNTMYAERDSRPTPRIERLPGDGHRVKCSHPDLPDHFVDFSPTSDSPQPTEILFADNELGRKDAISRFLTNGREISLPSSGSKCSGHFELSAEPGQQVRVLLLLSDSAEAPDGSGRLEDKIRQREKETLEFYDSKLAWQPNMELREICQLAYSGLLWCKQYYEYSWRKCHEAAAANGRQYHWNRKGWSHLDCRDILSMPDAWEFPWFASWDTGFQAAVMADIDGDFAQEQILLMLCDRYMSPDGQVPGCEFDFSDENPPVLAWAVRQVWLVTKDSEFVAKAYPALKRNFQWWLRNRSVTEEDAVYFQSGFLGMDNICAIDRSHVPTGHRLFQADAFAWVFMTAQNCLWLCEEVDSLAPARISERRFWTQHLARLQGGFRHFDNDGFCYDILEAPDGSRRPLRIRSMVGLLPAAATLAFSDKVDGGLQEAARLTGLRLEAAGKKEDGQRRPLLLALLTEQQRMEVFRAAAQEGERGFLGPYGLRMMCRSHLSSPYTVTAADRQYTLSYEPGESRTLMYGGNSNWRGPVWLCMNLLMVQAAQTLRLWRGEDTESFLGKFAAEVCGRVLRIFTARPDGSRPVHGDCQAFRKFWSDTEYVLFYEYFHGDTGRGCGASHQTGWTALVVKFASVLRQLQRQ